MLAPPAASMRSMLFALVEVLAWQSGSEVEQLVVMSAKISVKPTLPGTVAMSVPEGPLVPPHPADMHAARATPLTTKNDALFIYLLLSSSASKGALTAC